VILRPGEPRENVAPSPHPPTGVKIDGAAFKSSAPDQEATGADVSAHRVLPLGGLRIEGAETEALDDLSLIGVPRKIQEKDSHPDLLAFQRAGPCPSIHRAGETGRWRSTRLRENQTALPPRRGSEITSCIPTSQSVQDADWPCRSRSISIWSATVQCALSDSAFTRVSVAIQLTSQVLPPSSENACSKRHEFGVMSEITNRTEWLGRSVFPGQKTRRAHF